MEAMEMNLFGGQKRRFFIEKRRYFIVKRRKIIAREDIGEKSATYKVRKTKLLG